MYNKGKGFNPNANPEDMQVLMEQYKDQLLQMHRTAPAKGVQVPAAQATPPPPVTAPVPPKGVPAPIVAAPPPPVPPKGVPAPIVAAPAPPVPPKGVPAPIVATQPAAPVPPKGVPAPIVQAPIPPKGAPAPPKGVSAPVPPKGVPAPPVVVPELPELILSEEQSIVHRPEIILPIVEEAPTPMLSQPVRIEFEYQMPSIEIHEIVVERKAPEPVCEEPVQPLPEVIVEEALPIEEEICEEVPPIPMPMVIEEPICETKPTCPVPFCPPPCQPFVPGQMSESLSAQDQVLQQVSPQCIPPVLPTLPYQEACCQPRCDCCPPKDCCQPCPVVCEAESAAESASEVLPSCPPRSPAPLGIKCGEPMTTSHGELIFNDSDSLTVGDRGPVLMEDRQLLDKLSHFNRERIPERVVHAKGAGAFGCFQPCQCLAQYTCAEFLQNPNTITPVFVRFSTVIGSVGSADTERDPRGFAVKFYTNQGIYDLVGLHLPVFFINDAMKFPDFVHSLKPSPMDNVRYPARFFDFASCSPETTHAVTWLYSDLGTIGSYRKIDGFGVNTYVWVNAQGKRHFVKYHWKSMQGTEQLTREEAIRLAGEYPDIATEDLYKAIAAGEKVRYELYVQLLDPDLEVLLPFDPLDATKLWDEAQFPLMKVGMLTLDRNPQNFFTQVEQSAFAPSNLVPGIELSNDKLLQGRSFGYADAHRYRLGVNANQLPINRPLNPVNNNQQNGLMAIDIPSSDVNYHPNSRAGNRPPLCPAPKFTGPNECGNIGRYKIAKGDDFTQAGETYRSFTETQRAHLIHNLACDLIGAPADIQQRMIRNFSMADPEYGQRLAKALEK